MAAGAISEKSRFRAAERGLAALEFALLSPLFILIIMGLSEAGAVMLAIEKAQSHADAAARVAARLPQIPALPSEASLAGGLLVFPPALPAIRADSLPSPPDDARRNIALFWGCGTPSGVVRHSFARCPDGAPVAAYVEARVACPVERSVRWSFLPAIDRVEARALRRVE